MWRKGEEMKYRVHSTGGHAIYDEDFNGNIDEFIKFKFGSFHNMRDTGRDVEELGEPEPVIEEVKPTRKKKAAE